MPDAYAAITPEARIGELLERWPALEEVLVALSPHFKALRNPVLRRTVAKIATLRQVAQVSGVPLGVLVERLRAAVGAVGSPSFDSGLCEPYAQDERNTPPAPQPGWVGDGSAAAAPRPEWADAARVARTHDARAAIEAGEHPLPAVMEALAGLRRAEVYELVTPFVPAPLVDLARSKGFEAHSVAEGEALVRTFFRRRDG